MELKKLKEKSLIKEEDINEEITTELPKRSILEISLSDIKNKKNCKVLEKKLVEKDKYIKQLEKEIYNQRKENIKLKKSENECLLKISTLEDELRVLKNKFMQYHTRTEDNSAYKYGEKLVRSMWIRDNIIDNKINNNNFRYNNNNNNTSTYNSNTNHANNTNSNMTFNNYNIKTGNRNSFYKNKWNAPWVSQSYRKRNNDEYNNMMNNGSQNNFQRVSEMIMNKNDYNQNKIRLNKNKGNTFNRYKNGNNYNNNNF